MAISEDGKAVSWGICVTPLPRPYINVDQTKTVAYVQHLYPVECRILHCKKSWRSSSTPASGDAGPIHTGVEKSFRHPLKVPSHQIRSGLKYYGWIGLCEYKDCKWKKDF